jgi:hypothetical protein
MDHPHLGVVIVTDGTPDRQQFTPGLITRLVPSPRTKVNYRAVLVAAGSSLVDSAVYCIVLGNAWLTLRGIDPGTAEMTPQVWQMAGQLARNLVVGSVLHEDYRGCTCSMSATP